MKRELVKEGDGEGDGRGVGQKLLAFLSLIMAALTTSRKELGFHPSDNSAPPVSPPLPPPPPSSFSSLPSPSRSSAAPLSVSDPDHFQGQEDVEEISEMVGVEGGKLAEREEEEEEREDNNNDGPLSNEFPRASSNGAK